MKVFVFSINLVLGNWAIANDYNIYVGEYPPFIDSSKADQGTTIKKVKAAFSKAGANVNITFVDWNRAYTEVKKGNKEISLLWIEQEKRKKDVLFGPSILDLKTVFFYRDGVDFKWENLDDLKPYKIGITRGFAYTDGLMKLVKSKQIKYSVSNGDVLNLEKLSTGDIDIFPCAEDVCESLIKKNKLKGIKKFSGKALSVLPHKIIVSKGAEVQKIINLF